MASNTITDHATYYTTDYGTSCPVLFIDHGPGYGPTGATNDSTLSCFTPAFVGFRCIGRSRAVGATV